MSKFIVGDILSNKEGHALIITEISNGKIGWHWANKADTKFFWDESQFISYVDSCGIMSELAQLEYEYNNMVKHCDKLSAKIDQLRADAHSRKREDNRNQAIKRLTFALESMTEDQRRLVPGLIDEFDLTTGKILK